MRRGSRLGGRRQWFELANAGRVVIPHDFINMLYQSTIAILLLVGFESVTALGAEAINPDKDIKRGVLLSLIIQGGICYLFEYFAANFAIGAATITTPAVAATRRRRPSRPRPATRRRRPTSAPIGTMIHTIAEQHLGHTGTTVSLIVAITVLLALIGTTLACLNTGVRVTYAHGQGQGDARASSASCTATTPPRTPASRPDHPLGRHRGVRLRALPGRQPHPDHPRLQHRDVPGLRGDLRDRRDRLRQPPRQAHRQAHRAPGHRRV